jgi:hypothetical protein
VNAGATKMRPWIRWTIGLIWLGTAIVVGVLFWVKSPATATVTVHVSEISFQMDPGRLFDEANQQHFAITGRSNIAISMIPQNSKQTNSVETLSVLGSDATSLCNFYNVRISPLTIAGKGEVTLLYSRFADPKSFSIRTSQPVNGTIAALQGNNLKSAFNCSQVTPAGSSPTSDLIQGQLSPQFASSYRTGADAQFSFREADETIPEENQIRVTGDILVAHVEHLSENLDPTTNSDNSSLLDEKSSMLPSLPGKKNEVVFDGLPSKKSVSINSSDLLLIKPEQDFYIRRLQVEKGIDLEFHGTAKQILLGAGAKDLKNCMPSMFEMLDSKKRGFTVIPSIVAFIVGFLEAIGVLPKKK